MLFFTKKVYKKAKEIDADLYHIHDPELLPYGLKLKKLGKKVIFDSHEYYPMQINHKKYIPPILRNVISKAYEKYETFAVNRMDAVIFPCEINGEHPFKGRCKRNIFIDNVPREEVFCDQDNNIENEAKPFAICYVGTLAYGRGITHLIKAAHIAGVKLILAGQFMSENYKQELMDMPEYSCVDYRGYCSRQEIEQIYRDSNVGIATVLNIGQYEIQSNLLTKTYEYMAMGLPVIANDSVGIRRVNDIYNFALVVDPSDSEKISNAIMYLKNNPETAKCMGNNGKRAINEKYNWEREEKKLICLYEEVLK